MQDNVNEVVELADELFGEEGKVEDLFAEDENLWNQTFDALKDIMNQLHVYVTQLQNENRALRESNAELVALNEEILNNVFVIDTVEEEEKKDEAQEEAKKECGCGCKKDKECNSTVYFATLPMDSKLAQTLVKCLGLLDKE